MTPRLPVIELVSFRCCSITVVAVAILALTFGVLTHVPLWHTDVWGHLRFGEYIVEEGCLPQRECFSGDFADQDSPYVNFQWLTQAGGYLIYWLGGSLGGSSPDAALVGGALLLSAIHALLVTARLLLLLVAYYRPTSSMPIAFGGMLLSELLAGPFNIPVARPQVVGELLFALILVPLSRPLLSGRAIVFVPIVLVLWANSHGSFLVGLVLLGTFLVGRAFEVVRNNWQSTPVSFRARLGQCVLSTWRDSQIRRLALTLVLALAAVFALNPHGPALIMHSLEMSNHPNVQMMSEWRPLRLQRFPGWCFIVSVLVVALLLLRQGRRFTPTQILLLTGFGVQAVAHERMLVWWFMVFPWVVVQHFQQSRCRLPWLLRGEDVPGGLKATCAALIAGVLLLWSAPVQWLVYGESPTVARCLSRESPVSVVNYLRDQYEKDRRQSWPRLHGNVFSSETLGDYLLFHLRPNPPVRLLCYTHVHLLHPDHWRACSQIKAGARDWKELLDRYRVDFIVLETRVYSTPTGYSNLIDQIRASDKWEVVPEFDRKPVIVARRKPSGQLTGGNKGGRTISLWSKSFCRFLLLPSRSEGTTS